ncbi:hypothetical protein V8B97DRAFT_1877926, partial [Scleroderma yunnanense]
HNLLLSASATLGSPLSLNEFCTAYSLSDTICQKLDENSYTGSNMISYICISKLKDMGLKYGEIAAMKNALRQWIARA